MLCFLNVGFANSELPVNDGRIVEENVFLAFACPAFTNVLEGLARVSARIRNRSFLNTRRYRSLASSP